MTSRIITKDLKKLHALAEVNLLLDSYDDLFSDFDSSPYAEKTLSDDFISQAKRISKNKLGTKIALRFLIPSALRNEVDETIIIKRLSYHFRHIHQQLKADIKKTILKGWLLLAIGISLMVIASYLSFIKSQVYYLHLLLVLFEPAGWFLLWAGLDNLVYDTKDSKKELSFYSKMMNSKIEFFTLENAKKNNSH